jgi:membrane protein required for beta-lactamase induction
MSILGNTGYEEFNRLLREWRRAGKKISWPELAEAYKLAQEAEARERSSSP